MGSESNVSEEKLRIRTPEEREQHADGLKELKTILDSKNVPFFLGGGTLLGAYRDGGFIPWDWDISINLRFEDVKGRNRELVEAFVAEGFVIDESQTRSVKDGWKISLFKYGIKYELLSWHLKESWRYRRGKRIEDRFFTCAESISFYGQIFPCFGPIEDFLTHHYGDWRTPKRTADKREYNSPEFYAPPSLSKRIKSFARKVAHLVTRSG